VKKMTTSKIWTNSEEQHDEEPCADNKKGELTRSNLTCGCCEHLHSIMRFPAAREAHGSETHKQAKQDC